jgi:hypothetical protein
VAYAGHAEPVLRCFFFFYCETIGTAATPGVDNEDDYGEHDGM